MTAKILQFPKPAEDPSVRAMLESLRAARKERDNGTS